MIVNVTGLCGIGKSVIDRGNIKSYVHRAVSDEHISCDHRGATVFDAGAPQTDTSLRLQRQHFGMVFQSFNLFPQYTVLGNLLLAPTCALKNAKGHTDAEDLKALEVRANALLERVGLSSKANEYPCRLSGGQQQRVAIARALMLDPQILCFDEPTSALDPELTGEVLKVIRDLKSADSTMVVVTHEMEFARHVSDKVIYMADGVIEEMGTPEQVFDHPRSEKTRAFLRGTQDKF